MKNTPLHTYRFALIGLIVLFLQVPVAGSRQTDLPVIWSKQPATPQKISRRIEEAASQAQPGEKIPFAVLYDIGYPEDGEEFTRLDGHAVMLLTAMSHAKEELPLGSVSVDADGQTIELKLIKSVLSDQTGTDSQSVKLFGPFRVDALYLLPIRLRQAKGILKVDFAKNHLRLEIAKFGSPLPEKISRFVTQPQTGTGPSAPALDRFIKREFPAFIKE